MARARVLDDLFSLSDLALAVLNIRGSARPNIQMWLRELRRARILDDHIPLDPRHVELGTLRVLGRTSVTRRCGAQRIRERTGTPRLLVDAVEADRRRVPRRVIDFSETRDLERHQFFGARRRWSSTSRWHSRGRIAGRVPRCSASRLTGRTITRRGTVVRRVGRVAGRVIVT